MILKLNTQQIIVCTINILYWIIMVNYTLVLSISTKQIMRLGACNQPIKSSHFVLSKDVLCLIANWDRIELTQLAIPICIESCKLIIYNQKLQGGQDFSKQGGQMPPLLHPLLPKNSSTHIFNCIQQWQHSRKCFQNTL